MERLKNPYPMRVDPDFWLFVKEAVQQNPQINQRQVTRNIAKKKLIVGELIFNPEFERLVMQELERHKKMHKTVYSHQTALERIFR